MFPEYTPDMLIEDPKGERWVTINHRHVKIDGNGNIIAGLGGKFNGSPIQKAIDHLNSPEGSKKNKVTPEESSKKIKQAISIVKNNKDLSSKELKDIFMKNLGMSAGGAAVYLTKVKKKIADAADKEDTKKVEKTESKKEESKSVQKTPEVTKDEEKKDKTEKKDNKMKQAEAIYKAMPGAKSKDVQAKFKSQIGMSSAMASLYYHKLKKKFGMESKPSVDDVVKDVYKKHAIEKGSHLVASSKGELHKVFQEVQKQFPDVSIEDVSDKIMKHHFTVNKQDYDAVFGKKSSPIDKSQKDQEKQSDTKSNKSSQDTEISKKTEIDDEKYKKLAQIHSKYESGLINKAEAIKQLYTDLKMDTWDAAKMWHDHVTKAAADENEKQEIANEIYKQGKKDKKKFSEIANEVKKALGVPYNVIKYMDKAEEAHKDEAYKYYKSGKFNGHDDTAIASKFQTHMGLSYDDAWNMLSDLDLKHKQESKDHLSKAVDLIDKHKSLSYYDHVDIIGNELGLSPEAAEQMTSNAHASKKEFKKNTAIQIYKKGKQNNEDTIDILDKIKDNLQIDHTEAQKLYNIAKNSLSHDDIHGKKTYDDVKSKIDDYHGGAKVHYNHNEDTSVPEPEHVKTYHSKVELAKKVNAHKAFDFHEHVVKPASLDFYKQKQSVKDMSYAVYEYTGSSYEEINRDLRSGNDKTSYHKNTIKNLDKAFKHKSAKVKKDTMVYRGFTSEFANNLEPGDVLHDKGFMSTSSEEYKANNWASTYGAVIHILLPKGASAMTVRHCSKFESEEEVLVNRGAKIKIIKKEKRNDLGGVTLYGEYIVEDSPKKSKKSLDKDDE